MLDVLINEIATHVPWKYRNIQSKRNVLGDPGRPCRVPRQNTCLVPTTCRREVELVQAPALIAASRVVGAGQFSDLGLWSC